MQASWTTFSECNSRFPTSSGYTPSTTYDSSYSTPTLGSSSDIDDYGDASCRMLNELGSTGDETDRLTASVLDDYC